MARSDGPGGFAVAATLFPSPLRGRGSRGGPVGILGHAARPAPPARGRGGRARHRHARHRARPPPGPHQRRAGLGQCARRMAVGAVADPGDGPLVHRQRGRAAAASSTGWCWRSSPATPTTPRATKRRCARATNCSPSPTAPIPPGSPRWKRGWPSMARRWPRRAPRTVEALDARLADSPDDDFARASLALEGGSEGDLAQILRANRGRDAAAGRATHGPHRQDLAVTHRANVAARQPLLDRRAEGAAARHRARPTPTWSPTGAARRRSCCSTKSPRTSTPAAALPCSRGSKAAARCG